MSNCNMQSVDAADAGNTAVSNAVADVSSASHGVWAFLQAYGSHSSEAVRMQW